jgi:hypothetical protein
LLKVAQSSWKVGEEIGSAFFMSKESVGSAGLKQSLRGSGIQELAEFIE